jgi:hypothetical protein
LIVALGKSILRTNIERGNKPKTCQSIGWFVWLRQENGMLDCCAANLRADAKMSECMSDCCMGLVSRIDTTVWLMQCLREESVCSMEC